MEKGAETVDRIERAREKERKRNFRKVGGTKGSYKSSTSVLPVVAAPGGRACAFSSRQVTFCLGRMFVFSERGENGSPGPRKPHLGPHGPYGRLQRTA